MKCSASEDAGLWVCLQETVRRVSIRTPPTPSSAFQSPWATRASRTSSRSENLFMLAQLSHQLFSCGVTPFIPHYFYISHYIYICGCRSFIQSSSIWRCFSPLDLSRGGQQIIETFFFFLVSIMSFNPFGFIKYKNKNSQCSLGYVISQDLWGNPKDWSQWVSLSGAGDLFCLNSLEWNHLNS